MCKKDADLFADLPDDDADQLRAAGFVEVPQKGTAAPLWRAPDGGVYSKGEAIARLEMERS